jgi:hypothetical protein
MGASQGKSKKEQKEEARQWAETKDTEITTLYGENTKLMNDVRLLQVDLQTMKRTMEQQQRIIENMSKENAAMSRKYEDKLDECCPTTQEAHDAELQRMFDEEWELVLSSHAIVSAQLVATGGHLDRWDRLDSEGLLAATNLKPYGYPQSSIVEMRRRHDDAVKHHKELFKFRGNSFRSIFRSIYKCPDELNFERGEKLGRGAFRG